MYKEYGFTSFSILEISQYSVRKPCVTHDWLIRCQCEFFFKSDQIFMNASNPIWEEYGATPYNVSSDPIWILFCTLI
jgi:hypothetical protein